MKSDRKYKVADKKNGKSILILILCAVIIVMLAAVIVLLLRKQSLPQGVSGSGDTEPKRNVVVTESNAEEAVAQMAAEDFVEPGYYIANMATEWHFSTGDAISFDARVDNILENTNPVYFDVFLAEDETEPIYRSPVIPVGSFLEYVALDKVLEAGTYDCVVVYHLVDEEQNTISTLRVAIRVIVEA